MVPTTLLGLILCIKNTVLGSTFRVINTVLVDYEVNCGFRFVCVNPWFIKLYSSLAMGYRL